MSTARFSRLQEGLLGRFGITAESRWVEVATTGGRAHVLVTGEGSPIVMVPGGGTPAAGWAPLMAELKGFRLYAIELPGFGLTGPAPLKKSGLRTVAVRYLEQVLDGLDLSGASFVANSMGSLWTTWLALDRPERVKSMVHIGCPALILGTSAPFPMRLMSVPAVGRLMMKMQPPSPKQVDRMFAAAINENLSSLPEMRALMVALQQLPSFGPSWLELLHSVIRLRGARPEVALTADELAQTTQPVQLIWGKGDPFGSPDVGERAARIIPEAELYVIPGGHGPWLSRAERVAQLAVPFLRKHARS